MISAALSCFDMAVMPVLRVLGLLAEIRLLMGILQGETRAAVLIMIIL